MLLAMPSANPTQNSRSLATLFEILGDKTRYQIFTILLHRNDICVTEISEKLGISVPGTSQQLRLMELAGLVHPVRMGQMICYTLVDDPTVRSLADLVERRS